MLKYKGEDGLGQGSGVGSEKGGRTCWSEEGRKGVWEWRTVFTGYGA